MLYRRNNDLFSLNKSLHSGFLHSVKNSIQSRGDEEGQERGEAQTEDDSSSHASKNNVEEQRNHA